MLECLLTGSGYGVKRVDNRDKLMTMFGEEETVLALYDFNTKSGNEKDIRELNAGADDVLDREGSNMEALARIQAQIRCYKRLVSARKPVECIKMDELEMDDSAKMVTVRGKRVDLTPTEYKILHLLLEKPGRVLSNKQIYESIWKMSPIGADNTIAVHIRHIREKIEVNPQEPRYLQVVWGQGYKVG